MKRYELMKRFAPKGSVQRLCGLLGVARSGYYLWCRAEPSQRQREDRRLKQRILSIHGASRGCYGTPRVHLSLLAEGEHTSRKRVARLRRELALKVRTAKSFRVTTRSSKGPAVAPNRLERRFTAEAPNQAWVGDITYLWTPEGWLYLAILLDLFSRKVVGWAVSERIDSDLAETALERALEARRPPPGLLHHTDQGSTYTSRSYREQLATAGLEMSLSRRGNCWDNAVAESFFRTLKTEIGERFDDRRQAQSELFAYLEGFYNTHRIHTSIGGRSPAACERQYHQRKYQEAGSEPLRGSLPGPKPPEERTESLPGGS